jgi:uncharacterized protein YcnI
VLARLSGKSTDGAANRFPRMGLPKTTWSRALRTNRWLRTAALATAALGLLLLPGSAWAHVTMTPPFVDAAAKTRVAFAAPNERPPHATVSLVVKAPPGVELEPATPPAGWRLELTHDTARWTGGRIEGERTVSFPLAVTARTRAGTELFKATQGYDDGESVRWQAGLTVLPAAGSEAPSQHLDRALAAGGVGLVVIAASFLALRFLRQRPLQER